MCCSPSAGQGGCGLTPLSQGKISGCVLGSAPGFTEDARGAPGFTEALLPAALLLGSNSLSAKPAASVK